jgi:prepilin-type N-terminal cleavage/methylation domain-containing protein
MSRGAFMNNQRGFTLAEMLVVCAIVGLVMASILGLVMQGHQAYWFGTTQVDGQQTVRVAIERIAKEIREAGYEPLTPETNPTACPDAAAYPLYSGVPCYKFTPITAQSATALTLQYNWNGSTSGTHIDAGMVTDPMLCATVACRGEQVTYALSGSNLTRQESGVDGTPVIIASGITGLTFTYRDDNNNVTTAQDLMRIVEISVTAQTASQGAFVTMVDRIRLRNR